MKVIIIDDSISFRVIIRDYVSSLLPDAEICVFEDIGFANSEIYSIDPPSLIISDVMMPYMLGTDAVTLIRSHERTKEIPIILVSSTIGIEAKIDAKDTYIKFIAKDVNIFGNLKLALIQFKLLEE